MARLGEAGPAEEILKSLEDSPAPSALYARAETLTALGRVDEARAAIAKSESADPENGTLFLNLACLRTILGDHDEAIRLLSRALGRHPFLREQARTDPDLHPLRADPRFAALIEKAGKPR